MQKLILYKQYKLAAADMDMLAEERARSFRRGNLTNDLQQIAQQADMGDELTTLDLYRLLLVYDKLMRNYDDRNREVRHTVVKYPYSIEEQKKAIASLLEINSKLDFGMIVRNSENKVQFVYNFLAILEMLQQQLLELQIGLGMNNFSVTTRTN